MLTHQVPYVAGNSNGSVYYVLLASVERGYIKLKKLQNNPCKGHYAHLLTMKGIWEKSLLSLSSIGRKRQESNGL